MCLAWSLDILESKNLRNDQELGLLGVERGSPGPKGPVLKGLKNLAQGLPWVSGEALRPGGTVEVKPVPGRFVVETEPMPFQICSIVPLGRGHFIS
jgi:hypothetical protein